MADWIIQFESFRRTSYEVHVGGAGTTTYLRGAAQPFVTEEDDNNDEFIPVRLQSGFLRIVDDGYDLDGNIFDWHALIPTSVTSRPVTLYRGSSIMWRGYIQPMSYSSGFGLPIERSFAVFCPLSILDGKEISIPSGASVSFGTLLASVLYEAGYSNSQIYAQSQYWDSDYADCLIQTDALTTIESGDVKMKYNCLELLCAICRFWGMTARSYQNGVVLMSATGGSLTWNTVSIGSSDYCDADGQEIVISGYYKAKVVANIEKEENIVSYPTPTLLKTLKSRSVSYTTLGTDKYLFKTNPIFQFSGYEMNGDAYYDQSGTYGQFVGLDFYDGALADKHNYNWSWAIDILVDYVGEQSDSIPARLWTTKKFLFPSGLLVMTAGILHLGESLAVEGRMHMRVGIGETRNSAIWWTGSDWSALRSAFEVNIGAGQGIWCNRQLTSSNAAYNGWGIPLYGTIYGCLFIDFLGSNYIQGFGSDQTKSIQVVDFTLQYVANTSRNDDEENVYETENQSDFPEKKNVDVDFASYNNNSVGARILMDSTGDLLEKVYTPQGYKHPEQYLADRMSSWGMKARSVFSVPVNSVTVSTGSPLDKVAIAGKTCYAQSIARDWRDDVVRYKFVEL